MAKKVPFGAIPVRALSDPRLTALHFRALGICAVHDRMSLVTGKGQGCWASSATMAEEIGGFNFTNVSAALGQLAKWGYLQVERRPGDARLRVYRVIYEAEDSLPYGQTNEADEAEDRLPVGKEPRKVVCPPDELIASNDRKISPQYISQSDVRDFAEATERNSAKAARRGNATRRVDDDGSDLEGASGRARNSAEAGFGRGGQDVADGPGSHGALAQFERAFKADPASVGPLDENVAWLTDLYVKRNDAVGRRAERLLGLIDSYLADQAGAGE